MANSRMGLRSIISCLAIGCLINLAGAQENNPAPTEVFRGGWIVAPEERTGGRGRVSLPKDALEWARVQDQLNFPETAGTAAPSTTGMKPWRWIDADEQGNFADRELGRGWLAIAIDRDQAGVGLLDVRGAAQVRVNGTPRGGDVYANGQTEIPIPLAAGRNWLLLSGARGRVSAKLTSPAREHFLSLRDATFPHVVKGEQEALWGALMVVNTTAQTMSGFRLRTTGTGLTTTYDDVPPILPHSTRKVPFRIQFDPAQSLTWSDDDRELPFQLELLAPVIDNTSATTAGQAVDSIPLKWELRSPSQLHHRTFVSRIDGSVQYYAVLPPATASADENRRPGLVLALHGAGVEGGGHAAAYSAKPNLYLIAPTNRRNFGFDWEDWGRWDALEVLEQAEQRFQTDRQRTYLTGHSMGGHGTWHLGTLFPDRFAVVGPSAGWISFSTYAGGNNGLGDDPVSPFMLRAISATDTLARVENLKMQGVYILHGDRDDNVPVGQARTMREALAKFHPDFVYKEQPGAGHWWGNACCDWPPLFRFFEDHQLPQSSAVQSVDFVTPNPAASSRCHWVEIIQQSIIGQPSRVTWQFDPAAQALTGTTENVSRLHLNLETLRAAPGRPTDAQAWKIKIDNSELTLAAADQRNLLELVRQEANWSEAPSDNAGIFKRPDRGSGFKEAFRNRFLLVYGTQGHADENRWMQERARFDAETYRYRGNASVDIMSDEEFAALDHNRPEHRDRSVIVYGNATINTAWSQLLATAPVQISRDQWQIKDRLPNQGSHCVLMLRPRASSSIAAVAAIGGTDLLAMQATDRLPIFSAGTGYPDLLIMRPDYLIRGHGAVRLVGYFGNDWEYDSGDWFEVATAVE